MTEAMPQKRGLAIASLVCALFCAPAALVLGIMALTKKDQGGKGMAVAGVVLGGLFTVIGGIGILAGLLLPVLSKAREAANTTTCIVNLKQIGLGMRLYEDREGVGHYPPDLETLYKTGDVSDPRLFLCKTRGGKPGTDFRTQFEYLVPPQGGVSDPHNWVVAYDDAPCHRGHTGRVVLFLDGSARFVPELEFQALLASSTPRP